MKQTGIVDRFEGEYVIVEIGDKLVEIPRAQTPDMLAEGMVVLLRDGQIIGVDQIETQRMENDMRRRFERILGKSDE